jgi:HSP20 family protein
MAKKVNQELAKTEPTGPMQVARDTGKLWFEDFFRKPFATIPFPTLRFVDMEWPMPSVDIYEDNDDVVLKAELPGMKKEDIDITLSGDVITISGERKQETEVKKKGYYRRENSYGSFNRSFALPAEVQADKVKTKFTDGILEIRMPKSEEAKKKEKKIKVE